jgi:very-short-patch-repair endonuclease
MDDLLMLHCKCLLLPVPEKEYRFHPTRRWRFDYAFPLTMLAIEIDGGAFSGGRHTRGAGFVKDMEKLNEAAILGWRVLRFTPDQVKRGLAALQIQRWFYANIKT